MAKYAFRRLLLFIPSLLLASLLLFFIMRVLPGDVALAILGSGDDVAGSFQTAQVEKLRELLGLSKPLVFQYFDWMGDVLSGKIGVSLQNRTEVRDIIVAKFPATAQLSLYAILISIFISVPLGIIAGLNSNRWPDYVIRIITIFGLAMPNFWVALLILLALVQFFSWVPPLIYQDLWENPGTHLQIMVWPALVLAWGFSSYLTRMTRASVLEVLSEDFVRTAYSKGLTRKTVIFRHVLRNSMIPVLTLGGLYLGSLLNGTVILEAIMGVPGIGSAMVDAIRKRDYPVVQGLGLFFICIMLVMNLLVDLLYGWIDPRIKYS